MRSKKDEGQSDPVWGCDDLRAARFDDSRWKRLTNSANAALKEGQFETARTLYDRAVIEAERLFESFARSDYMTPAIILLVISAHNRADMAKHLGDSAQAREQAIAIHDRITSIAENSDRPPILRVSAARNLRHTMAYLHLLSADDPILNGKLFRSFVNAHRAVGDVGRSIRAAIQHGQKTLH